MKAQDIEQILSELKANSRGSIRNKSKVIDKIQAQHLKEVDDKLMDVRVFVAQIKLGHISSEAQKQIDEFIYKLQIK